MPILTQQINCNLYKPSKPYPTLPYYPTLPLLPYTLYLHLYYITILFYFTLYLAFLSRPYPRFTPTLPSSQFTPTLTLLMIPYTLFSLAPEPLERFASSFQVNFSLTFKKMVSLFNNGHAWT